MDKEKKSLGDLSVPFSNQFEAQSNLIKHSVPILVGRNLDTIDFEGTAVYFKRNDSLYLATALHVISNRDLAEILLPNDAGTFSSIEYHNLIAVHNDVVDLALFELKNPISRFEPLSYDQIREIEDSKNVFHMVGYPSTKVSRKSRNYIEFSNYFVITRPVEDAGKNFKLFDSRANFVCDFRKKNVLLGNGKVGTFPDPRGMSGGGVYEMFFDRDNVLVKYNLVGIMTEWNASIKRYIKCSMAGILKTMIEADFERRGNAPQ